MKLGTDVSIETKGALAIVTIERPEVRNALRRDTLQGIRDAIARIENDASLSGGIITGSGRLAFSAGADLKALHLADPSPKATEEFMRTGQAMCSAIWASSKPIVAAIDGYALGGGLEIALSCHQRVATPASKLGLPEINLGHLPAWGSISRLASMTSHRVLFSMVLSGAVLNGREGLGAGIIDELADPETLLEKAELLAKELSAGDPSVVARGLEIIRRCLEVEDPAVLALERWAAGIDFSTGEHHDRVKRFVEKS